MFYHILAHNHPMNNFEGFKALFQMLKVKNVGKVYSQSGYPFLDIGLKDFVFAIFQI
jgi:hypothetical protein